jgi:WD40 repeat protein
MQHDRAQEAEEDEGEASNVFAGVQVPTTAPQLRFPVLQLIEVKPCSPSLPATWAAIGWGAEIFFMNDEPKILTAHTSRVVALATLEKRDMFNAWASASEDGAVLLWDEKGSWSFKMKVPLRELTTLIEVHGGKLAVGSRDCSVHVLDPHTGTLMNTIKCSHGVLLLKASKDGKRIATSAGAWDVSVHDVESGALLQTLDTKHDFQILNAPTVYGHFVNEIFSVSGKLLSFNGNCASLWDSEKCELRFLTAGHCLAAVLNGALVTLGHDAFKVWDLTTGECVRTVRVELQPVLTMCVVNDTLLTVHDDGAVLAWR